MHWQTVDEHRLQAALLDSPLDALPFIEEGVATDQLTASAVLFPVLKRKNGLSALFTKRADHLKDHPGQISFPGGRMEPEDISASAAALREAYEEIGLPEQQVKIIGYLPDYGTITGYRITPVLGLVSLPFEPQSDPAEVDEVFEAPLDFILNPTNQKRHYVERSDKRRSFYAISYQDYFIWGATAGIIVSLTQRLALLAEN